MKRLIFCCLLLLLLLPMGTAFAQAGDDFDGRCDPTTALNDLVMQLSSISDADRVDDFLVYALNLLLTCGDNWAMQLGAALGLPIDIPGDSPAMPLYDAADGIMTADEAEFAVRQIYEGNFDLGLPYFCEETQANIVTEAPSPVIAAVTLNDLECRSQAGQMVCEVDVSIAGENAVETITFDITEGLLCLVE